MMTTTGPTNAQTKPLSVASQQLEINKYNHLYYLLTSAQVKLLYII
jgi:hypothetical protein